MNSLQSEDVQRRCSKTGVKNSAAKLRSRHLCRVCALRRYPKTGVENSSAKLRSRHLCYVLGVDVLNGG